jgi:hypothetical protein
MYFANGRVFVSDLCNICSNLLFLAGLHFLIKGGKKILMSNICIKEREKPAHDLAGLRVPH